MATNSKKYYDEVLQTATKSGANAVQAQQAAAEAVNKKYGGLGATSTSAPAAQTKTANTTASSRPAYTQSQNVTNAYNRVNSLTNSKPLPYKQSQAVSDAYNKLTALDGSKPSPYSSNYSQQINSLLNEITGRDKFTYNADSDPLYNQYKDKYTAMGKQAMQDTMGNAAALTGGYGSSYASTAGNQAYQAYLGQLNDKLPELYQLALDKYNNETNDMYNRMSLLQGLDNTDYGRYRDTVGDYYTDVSNAENRYNMLYNQDYGKYRDNMSDYYSDLSNATNWYNMLYNQDYGQYRDNVGDWENDRNYNRDVYENDRSFNYQKQQDELSQQNWEKQFERNNYESDRDYDRSVYESDRNYNRNVYESDRDYEVTLSKLEAAKDPKTNTLDGKEATATANEMFEKYDKETGEKYYTPENIAQTLWSSYSDCDNFEEWADTYTVPGSNKTLAELAEEMLRKGELDTTEAITPDTYNGPFSEFETLDWRKLIPSRNYAVAKK